MHFGCVDLVEQHGLTRSSRRARHVEHVVLCRDVTLRAKWNLGFTRFRRSSLKVDLSDFVKRFQLSYFLFMC